MATGARSNHRDDLLQRARRFLDRFQPQEALSCLEDESLAGDVRADATRVVALWMCRKTTEADNLLTALERRQPKHPDVLIAGGTVALGLRDDSQLLDIISGASRQDPTTAEKKFRDARGMDPASVSAACGVAAALRLQGRLSEAEDVLTTAVRDLGPHSALSVELASLMLDQWRVDEALKVLSAALDRDKDNAATLLALQQTFRTIGRLDDASRVLDRVAELLGPQTAEVQELLGWVELDLMDTVVDKAQRQQAYQTARSHFKRALEAEPWRIGPVSGLVDIVTAEEGPIEALDQLKAKLSREPRSPQLLIQAGWLEFYQWNYQEAGDRFASARRLSPRLVYASVGLIHALLSQEKYKEAKHEVELALGAFGRIPAVLNVASLIASNDGRGDEAVKLAEEYRQKAALDVEAAIRQAAAYRGVGDIGKAEDVLADAKKSWPGDVGLWLEAGDCAQDDNRLHHAVAAFHQVVALDVRRRRQPNYWDPGYHARSRIKAIRRNWWRHPLYWLAGEKLDKVAFDRGEITSEERDRLEAAVGLADLGRVLAGVRGARVLECRRLTSDTDDMLAALGTMVAQLSLIASAAACAIVTALLGGSKWVVAGSLLAPIAVYIAALAVLVGRRQVQVVVPIVVLGLFAAVARWGPPPVHYWTALALLAIPLVSLLLVIAVFVLLTTKARKPFFHNRGTVEGYLVSDLLRLSTLVDEDVQAWTPDERDRALQLIESIARTQSRLLQAPKAVVRRGWRQDLNLVEVVGSRAAGVSAATRQLKRHLLLPKSGSSKFVRACTRDLLRFAACRQWGSFRTATPESLPNRLRAEARAWAGPLILAAIVGVIAVIIARSATDSVVITVITAVGPTLLTIAGHLLGIRPDQVPAWPGRKPAERSLDRPKT